MSTTPATATERSEFRNVSNGVIGVNVEGDNGRMRGIPLKPGDTVWLSEREEIATANAPRHDKDNPFSNGALVLITKSSDIINRRQIGSREGVTPIGTLPPVDGEVDTDALDRGNEPVPVPTVVKQGEETGAPPLPEGDPALGVRAIHEEVATPQAVASGKRPPKGRGKTVSTDNPISKPVAKEGVAQGVVVGQGGARYVEPPGA